MENYSEEIFVYLDSHWYEDLPLNHELKILSKFENAIIFVDDFEIPNTSGWNFDSYSKTNITIEGISIPESYSIYFPTYKPQDDGGFKTGCAILVKGSKALKVINKNNYLYKYK